MDRSWQIVLVIPLALLVGWCLGALGHAARRKEKP